LITGMNSLDGEHIDLNKSVNPLNEEGVPLGVEDWLGEVERTMQSTLKDVFNSCLKANSSQKRENWLFNWPSQLVVAADQTIWTSRCVEAISEVSKKPQALKILLEKLNEELISIVNLVRTERPKTHRGTLGVLVVIEVHAKDVVEDLIRSEINDINSFEWLSQMRYYVEKETWQST
jgi:dynein heavy chain, axonemal